MQCGAVVWADVNRERNGASGGSAMCLDAAVMGTCPTFINQSRREEGDASERAREGEKGNSVRGDGRRERMLGEEGEEERFSWVGG